MRHIVPAGIPATLRLLLCVVAFFAVTWALVTPPFQAPDEEVHFAYVQSIAERGHIPLGDQQPLSTEERIARDYINSHDSIFHPLARIDTGDAAAARIDRLLQHADRDDGGGSSRASPYPPAAYALDAIPYLAGAQGDLFTRLTFVRVANGLLLVLTCLGAWLLAGEIFARSRVAQLATAATVGLWPMASFVSASVTPDALLMTTWSLILWLGVSVLRRGITRPRCLALGGLFGLALLTKPTSLVLVPALLFVLGYRLVSSRRPERREALRAALLFVAPVLVLAGGWAVVRRGSGVGVDAYQQAAVTSGRGLNVREFLTYVWQFYLPRLPFMKEQRVLFPVIGQLPLYNTWFGMYWGVYGWVNVWFPVWVYKVFLGVSALIVAGAGVFIGRWRKARGRWRLRSVEVATLVFLALVVGALLIGIHLSEYRSIVTNGLTFAQGRYLLSIGPIGALLVGAAVHAAGRFRAIALGALMGGLVAFQIISLALVVSRFYG